MSKNEIIQFLLYQSFKRSIQASVVQEKQIMENTISDEHLLKAKYNQGGMEKRVWIFPSKESGRVQELVQSIAPG